MTKSQSRPTMSRCDFLKVADRGSNGCHMSRFGVSRHPRTECRYP